MRTLVDARKETGYRTVVWNGQDDRGKEVANGVYFCKVEAEKHTETKKIIVLR